MAILSFGGRLAEALKAADLLAARGYPATVADARFAKPLDEALILRLAREHEALITLEEGAVGGFGAFVLQRLAERGALDRGLKVRTLTLPDVFQDQDKPEIMYAKAGLDAEGIVRAALGALGARQRRRGLAGALGPSLTSQPRDSRVRTGRTAATAPCPPASSARRSMSPLTAVVDPRLGDLGVQDGVGRGDVLGPHDALDGQDAGVVVGLHLLAALDHQVAVGQTPG